MRRTTAVVMLTGVMLAASACDATNEGTATPVSTTDKAATTEALWDPCQIDPAVLTQVGVDPSTADDTISGVENVEGWKLCSWHDKPSRWDYNLGVWSTVYSVDELKGDKNNIGFTDISIGGRSGVQFRKAHDTDDSVCYLAFPGSTQTTEISVYKTFSSKAPTDTRGPCEIASDAARILVPTFPA